MATKEQIDVMQAYIDGKTIQFRNNQGTNDWFDLISENEPKWDWDKYTYRIKTKRLPKTWDEFCGMNYKIHINEAKIYGCSQIRVYNEESIRDNENSRTVLPNKQTADAIVALCQLIQLRDYYNDGWQPDWTDVTDKYIIIYFGDCVYKTSRSFFSSVLAFKTAELRDEFLNNFRELIEEAKCLI